MSKAATLFWKAPSSTSDNSHYDSKKEKFTKSITKLLKNHRSLNALFDDVEDHVEHFCQLFFGDNQLPINCFLANLSLEDKSGRNIQLSLRIPNHATFAAHLPEHSTLAVIGHWPVRASSAVFIPETVIVTHNDDQATNYEHEIEFSCQYLVDGEYPEITASNILTRQLAQDLPQFSVLANTRLKEWQNFLSFKRNLVRQKATGLRFIDYKYNPTNFCLELLVVAESEKTLQTVKHSFSRQNIQLFDLSVSSDAWTFVLPEHDKNNRNKKQSRGFELAQISKNGLKIIDKNLVSPTVMQKLAAAKTEISFSQPVFALLTVEIDEEWNNKLKNLQIDAKDEETVANNEEILAKFYDEIPKQGFASISIMGDWALINRQERVVNNLRQNIDCYSPYLSSYLFDIKHAQQPDKITQVDQWFNADLNDAQKSAVKKMLSAPDLCLIQGPPGTGKTTVIAEAILQFAKEGKTILLASQAHDAIDNALSRIKNVPELRAIRLAKQFKGRSKITADGQQFAGSQALARHYEALAHHVDHNFLQPLKNQQSDIATLKSWIETGEFLQADAEINSHKLKDISIQGKEKADLLATASQQLMQQQQQFEQAEQAKQQLDQLIGFLQHTVNAPQYMSVPEAMLPLVETLFLLQSAQVKLHFTAADFKANSNAQMLIVTSLFETWSSLQQCIPQMRLDLARLQQAGNAGLSDVETTLQINALKQEVETISDQMENDSSDELASVWRKKRQQIKALMQKSGGLDLQIYQLFSDQSIFANINNAHEVANQLQQRLAIFSQIDAVLSTQKPHVLQQLQNQSDQLQLNPVDEKNVQRLQQEIASLRSDYTAQHERIQQIKQKQATHLITQNFQADQNFCQCLTAAKNHLEALKQSLKDEQQKQGAWHSLFEQWHSIVKQDHQLEEDWELVGADYVEHCNLVAISCNEGDRTLKEFNLDSFDVAIIDEVSKATPLELLLPLMRARKAILVGDHRQLPPVFQDGQDAHTFEDEAELQAENSEQGSEQKDSLLSKDNFKRYEKLVTASLFKELFEAAPDSLRERLTVQFRMHPDIMKMINYFYEGQLSCGNPELDRSHGVQLRSKNNILVSANDHLLWVDTSYDEKGATCADVDGSSNPVEARLIAQTLLNINQQMKSQGFGGKAQAKQKVGVVSFYQSQCRTIRDAIRKVNKGQIRFDAIDVEINTVIRYQGKEKPIILISLVRNDGKSKQHRRSSRANVARFEFINVAMSRAQNLLMVFGARNMLELRDIYLPKMDSQGTEKKKVYQDIFNRLDRDARIYTAKEFAQIESVA